MPEPLPNHYAALGLDRHCTSEQIRQAYRALARQFHPDRNPGSAEATTRIQEINAAHETLRDPGRRRAYDATLQAASRPASPRTNASRPALLKQDVPLRLEEFFRGTRLEVRVHDPGNPSGTECYTLVVPPGAAPGTRLRLHRASNASGGHLSVRLTVRPDFRFKVRGADLRCDLRLPARRAAQGGLETVRSVLGHPVRVPIPPGVARGTLIRIHGEGLPKPCGGRGNLLVRILYIPEVRITKART